MAITVSGINTKAPDLTDRRLLFEASLNHLIDSFEEYCPFGLRPSHPSFMSSGKKTLKDLSVADRDADPDEQTLPERKKRSDLRSVPLQALVVPSPTPPSFVRVLPTPFRSATAITTTSTTATTTTTTTTMAMTVVEQKERKQEENDGEEEVDVEEIKRPEEKTKGRKKGISDHALIFGGHRMRNATIRKKVVYEFLRSKCPIDIDEALAWFLAPPPRPPGAKAGKKYYYPRQILFRRCMPLTADKIRQIWKDAQKSDGWRKARYIRNTGSVGGYMIEWNHHETCLGQAQESIYGEFKSSPATEHGNLWEKPCAQAYLLELQRQLNYLYHQQRGEETGFITFRGKRIPLERSMAANFGSKSEYKAPHAKLYNIGMMADPLNHWRGVSIDGLVAINGIATHLVEIKCPYASGAMYLYPLEPLYYYTQSQDNLYTMRRYYPGLGTCDRVTFSANPVFGFIVDTHVLDADWYLSWYAVRAFRYFLGQFQTVMTFFGRLTESALYRFHRAHPELKGVLHGPTFAEFCDQTYKR